MSTPKCPTTNELSNYVRGTLAPNEAEAVTQHVAGCVNCEDTVHKLTSASDSLIDRISSSPSRQPFVDEAACRDRLVELKRRGLAQSENVPAPAADVRSQTTGARLTTAITHSDFCSFVIQAGFLTTVELAAVEKSLLANERDDPQTLAKALVERGHLTKYQAAAIYQGKGSSLVYGEHVVLDRIGAGGMGQVFKAKHRRMDRIVALKVMSSAAIKNTDAVRRFEREVRAAAKLSHPNIVHAYDAGVHDGQHFLVMEYVDGADLSSMVRQQGKLPVKQVCDYIAQAARGFAFAHGKGVIHRDIKPGNLLVAGDGTVKILDMGLARFDDGAVGGVMTEGELTQSGAVMGTVDYMAPEQALNTSRADAKSDVYGLGCTLYRLLTGESIYAGQTMVEKILAHRERPIPDLQQVRPEVPPALDALYRRMVAKTPAERPSMQEVADTFASIDAMPFVQTAVPVATATAPAARAVTMPRPLVARAVPPQRRLPTQLIAAGGAGAVLIACGVWFLIRDKDGNQLAEVYAPEGSSVHIESGKAPPLARRIPTSTAASVAAPTKSTVPPAAPPSMGPAELRPSPGTPEDAEKMFALPMSAAKQSQTAQPMKAIPSAKDLWLYCDPTNQAAPGIAVDTIRYDGKSPWTIEAWYVPRVTDSMKQQAVEGRSSGFTNVAFALVHERNTFLSNHWTWRPDKPEERPAVIHLSHIRDAGKSTARPDRAIFRIGEGPIDAPRHVAVCFEPSRDGKHHVTVWSDGKLLSSDRHALILEPQASLISAGFLGELRISRTVRYANEFSPQRRFEPDSDTLALFHCDEGSGATLVDASGNGHVGRLTNVKWAPIDGVPGIAGTVATQSPSTPTPVAKNVSRDVSPGKPMPDPQTSERLLPQASPREIAEWFLARQSVIYVAGADGKSTISREIANLPTGDLLITRIIATKADSVTDADLQALAQLTTLEILGIQQSSITGTGLVHLTKLPSLRSLTLTDCPLDDAAMDHVREMRHLGTLGIANTQVGDVGLAKVQDLPELSILGADGTRVTDAGVAAWNGFVGISNITLRDTAIGDAAVTRLMALPKLTRLSIQNTPVTDKCIPAILAKENIIAVNLQGTKISEATVKQLRDRKIIVGF
jgi:hypothetical protein